MDKIKKIEIKKYFEKEKLKSGVKSVKDISVKMGKGMWKFGLMAKSYGISGSKYLSNKFFKK